MSKMIYLPWNTSKARLNEAENAIQSQTESVAALSGGRVTRRDLITRLLIAAGGLLIAKETASAQAPTGMAPRARRAPVDRTKLPSWRTHVQIIEK